MEPIGIGLENSQQIRVHLKPRDVHVAVKTVCRKLEMPQDLSLKPELQIDENRTVAVHFTKINGWKS